MKRTLLFLVLVAGAASAQVAYYGPPSVKVTLPPEGQIFGVTITNQEDGSIFGITNQKDYVAIHSGKKILCFMPDGKVVMQYIDQQGRSKSSEIPTKNLRFHLHYFLEVMELEAISQR